MALLTRVYRTVYVVDVGIGGFRSLPAEVGSSSPADVPIARPLEHPVTVTTSGGDVLPQAILPTHTSILATEDLP